jgi:hypothetical protein
MICKQWGSPIDEGLAFAPAWSTDGQVRGHGARNGLQRGRSIAFAEHSVATHREGFE